MGPEQVLSLMVRVGLGVMSMKKYSILFRIGISPSNAV